MSVTVSEAEFDALIERALERIPEHISALVDNCVITIADESEESPWLLGLYDGVSITERCDYSGFSPDVITLYQIPLQNMCSDLEELEHQVYVTIVHELAHHFGIEDDRLEELHWD